MCWAINNTETAVTVSRDPSQLLFSLLTGYYGNGANAIIVFAACFLPDSDREDYHEIMENLFLWVQSDMKSFLSQSVALMSK